MKRLLTDSESIYLILEDKLIVLNVTFENIESEQPKHLLNEAFEYEFNPSLISDRSKILGYFQIYNSMNFELIGNVTSLDSFLLDFDGIDNNIGYKHLSFPNHLNEALSDNIFKLIKNKEFQ